MRKIILFAVLLGISAALAVDFSFVDTLLVGQTKVYRVGNENLTVRLLYLSESESMESKVILSINGEETRPLLEEEEDIILEGQLIVRVYEIFISEQKVRFGILGSGFSQEDKLVVVDKNLDEQEENASDGVIYNTDNSVDEENLNLESSTIAKVLENFSLNNNISDDKKYIKYEDMLKWKSADLKEKRVGLFARVWRWFISLFAF